MRTDHYKLNDDEVCHCCITIDVDCLAVATYVFRTRANQLQSNQLYGMTYGLLHDRSLVANSIDMYR